METIWKFQLKIADGIQSIEIPMNANILHFNSQEGIPCLWAKVDEANILETRKFFILGTGHYFPNGDNKYLGTAQFPYGLVFHCYEEV